MNQIDRLNQEWEAFARCVCRIIATYNSNAFVIKVVDGIIKIEPIEEPKTINGEHKIV